MKICILMSTYNGEKYLDEQLTSIEQQDVENLSVLIRDEKDICLLRTPFPREYKTCQ